MSETKTVQISLRLTPYVYEILKKRTMETGHSLNGEVIQAILEHCEATDRPTQIGIASPSPASSSPAAQR
jgi:hypothetical protein